MKALDLRQLASRALACQLAVLMATPSAALPCAARECHVVDKPQAKPSCCAACANNAEAPGPGLQNLQTPGRAVEESASSDPLQPCECPLNCPAPCGYGKLPCTSAPTTAPGAPYPVLASAPPMFPALDPSSHLLDVFKPPCTAPHHSR